MHILPIVRRCSSVAIATIVTVALARTLDAQATPRGVTTTRVAEGVFLFQNPPDGWASANSVAIITRSGVVVFDAPALREDARLIIAEIRKLTDQPVAVVVNSHWHLDHWSGNSAYLDAYPGAQVISTAATRGYMQATAAVWSRYLPTGTAKREAALAEAIRTGARADGRTLDASTRREMETELADRKRLVAELSSERAALPTRTYDDSLTLVRGGRTIRLFSMTGDASASTVAYLPAERIVILGDLLVHPVTWTTNSYQITPWLADLKRIRALDPKVVITGHGAVFHDTRYLDLVIEFFETTAAQVRRMVDTGAVTAAEIVPQLQLGTIRARFANGDAGLAAEFDGTAADLVARLVREFRDGMELRP